MKNLITNLDAFKMNNQIDIEKEHTPQQNYIIETAYNLYIEKFNETESCDEAWEFITGHSVWNNFD